MLGVSLGDPVLSAKPTPSDVLPPPPATITSPDGTGPGGPRRVANARATMMGVAAPTGASSNAPAQSAPPPSTPAAPVVSSSPPPPRGGTIHGVAPTVATPQVQSPAPRSGQTVQGVAPQQSLTSTGRHRKDVIMAGGAPPQERPAASGAAPSPHAQSPQDTFDQEFPVAPKKRGSALGWVLGGLLFMAAIGAGGWLYLHRTQGPTPLTATLRTQPGGEQMVSISLPDAAGAKVRYNGAEHAVDAQGHAEFPVTLPADRVGYIDVPVEVVRGASVEPRSMRFLVAWRAQTDLAKLGDDPPKIHIVFHVMRGSSLWIAGQQIRVSGETGIAELAGPAPSPAGEGDARRERYPVRVVTPDGTSIEEQYELRVPRTQLRVDDPPRVLMTREASIAVHGSAPTASRVRIGGQAATLSAGQFSAVVPVTAGSNSLDVVAYAPDGAPALVNLTVYRDVTPEAYLSSGGGDRSVAAIATRPPPEGARLRVTGTVVGNVIDAPTGRTCQIVVENRACPGGRCTAWVDLPPSVQVTPNAVVEVVGEIRGSRAYATQSGERRSDPVVLAVIITPRRS